MMMMLGKRRRSHNVTATLSSRFLDKSSITDIEHSLIINMANYIIIIDVNIYIIVVGGIYTCVCLCVVVCIYALTENRIAKDASDFVGSDRLLILKPERVFSTYVFFPTFPPWVRRDTRSIFKRSSSGLN